MRRMQKWDQLLISLMGGVIMSKYISFTKYKWQKQCNESAQLESVEPHYREQRAVTDAVSCDNRDQIFLSVYSFTRLAPQCTPNGVPSCHPACTLAK